MSLPRVTEMLETLLFGERLKVTAQDNFKTYTNEFNTAQTALTIVTPTTGHKAIPHNIGICTSSESGTVKMYWATSGLPIAILYCTKTNNVAYLGISNSNGTVNEAIKITSTTGNAAVFVGIDYEEV